jgi:zinc transporter ZupT
MQLLLYLLYSLLGYGWWWIAFVGLVYCAARYTPWPCIPVAFLIVAALMGYLSVMWVQAEMDKPGWEGSPDMDIVFWLGVLVRFVLGSIILWPAAHIGLRLKRQGSGASNARTAA